MIGRGPIRASHALLVSVLTACLTVAGTTTLPSAAVAAEGFPVTIVTADSSRTVTTAAGDVRGVLEENGISLGADDQVSPALTDRAVPGQTIRIVRVVQWTDVLRKPIAAKTVHRPDFAIAPGHSVVLSPGAPGVRATTVHFVKRDEALTKTVVRSVVLRAAKPRVIGVGFDEYQAFVKFGHRGLDKTASAARSVLRMVATAYTAHCAGCSGITASGRRAGHGIVAVDPRYISLGTRLYIPGYGYAIAGDTGGAIRGNRIDLGFNSRSDALQFGRRTVTVYQLK